MYFVSNSGLHHTTCIYETYEVTSSAKKRLCLSFVCYVYLNYPNITRVASNLINVFERNSFYAWTKFYAMLEMSTSFMHTMHRALCLSPLTSCSHSLYGDFWSHKLLKTHLPIVLNLSLVKQNTNNQHQPKQGSTRRTWLFTERANSTKHFIDP